MNIYVLMAIAAALLASKAFFAAATVNCFVQTAIFVATAQVPAWFTGRMSYVDIAWPYGLVAIGATPWLAGGATARSTMIAIAFLIAGGRMAFGATVFLFKGVLNKEFPR